MTPNSFFSFSRIVNTYHHCYKKGARIKLEANASMSSISEGTHRPKINARAKTIIDTAEKNAE